MIPERKITTSADLALFEHSAVYGQLVGFIEALNGAVKGIKLTDAVAVSEPVAGVVALLDELDGVVDKYPPTDNGLSRFGNPAFQQFYDETASRAGALVAAHVPSVPADKVDEVARYVAESFGNRSRIDYGSGHELNFACFLLCLDRLGVVAAGDRPALVLRAFARYLRLMRRLQTEYWLEPAGSHGVWGLDDYHFLPFLFGSAQLVGHRNLRPKSIHDADVLEMYRKDYLYLDAVWFVNSVKTATLRWSSPMLDDISGVKTWDKVNSGMIKMYKAEVLGKLPIVQHFLFGSILALDLPAATAEAEHVHTFGDCCGIKVPSAIAASQAAARDMRAPYTGSTPVPFD
ncbi:Phosphotyrosyl phosphatase activator [Dipodascopsis tothii]|uniref:Phosphotyrosyl phosphatase activator n=1 Tax=Dipodascopsis tothii TaxID=44089 RepID=UPI0034CFBBD5